MPSSPARKGSLGGAGSPSEKSSKLGLVSGVYIPVCLNIMSILMFLRFGLILGQVGFIGILGLLVTAYCVNLLTTLSLSAIASNGEVKGGGAYYLISRSLGPEFGGSIGILFFLAQVLNTALNVVGLIDCIRLNVGSSFPHGYWKGYGLETASLLLCTGLCLLGSATFSKASNALLAVLALAVVSIPVSAIFRSPFQDEALGVEFTGLSLTTFANNFLPHPDGVHYKGVATFRDLFGILFPATSGIFAGASMSGDLRQPSKAIPKGTLQAMLTTFTTYLVVVTAMAATTTRSSFLHNTNVISATNLSMPLVLAGECAVTLFSVLMGIIGSAKLFQALSRDKLLPGLSLFGKGTKTADEPIHAIFLVYVITQLALFADLNQIATLISMGYQMTFFVMNLACFLLKIGSAPNFRPSFKFFSWQTALLGSLMSAAAMFFIDETYAAVAICAMVFIFLLIHYLCPPKRWGDVSQNLIYHQVRKYLLRLKPEHIKFWRPHIILLINNPRQQTRLIQFCNSMKKGSLYILGHVIVTDDFNSGVHEARLQQAAWTNYISEFSRIKAFVQLTMSPSLTWGIRNLILSAGLGGMRPNIAVLGFYNMDDLRKSNPPYPIPDIPNTTAAKSVRPSKPSSGKDSTRRRGDTSARLLEGFLPTDVIRTENMIAPTEYMTMLEDLALRYRVNVAVAYGFHKLETPRNDDENTKRYIDLWPIQMSAEVSSEGKNVLTTNFDTYTLILQLGHILGSVYTWKRVYTLRVMVFVEYESEVEEESARVRALLEKLRIEAEVKVFWLACGQLNSYELIVNGECGHIDWQICVNDALRDEQWWDDLQMFRGQASNMSASQELKHLTQILDSTVARPGAYNPHEEADHARRRPSMAAELPDVHDLPKNPAIGILSKLGVNVGIHTHHLADEMFQDAESDFESSAESSESEEEYGLSALATSPWLRSPPISSVRQPLLSNISERSTSSGFTDPSHPKSSRKHDYGGSTAEGLSTYGTLPSRRSAAVHSSSRKLMEQHASAQEPETPSKETCRGRVTEHTTTTHPRVAKLTDEVSSGLASLSVRRSRSMSPLKTDPVAGGPSTGAKTPTRPTMSRQTTGTNFSSRPLPHTKITSEGDDLTIGFAGDTADTDARMSERPAVSRQPSQVHLAIDRQASEVAKPTRPTPSRQSSYGRFSSRPVPEPLTGQGQDELRTITFAEQPVYHTPSASHSRAHSRQNSNYAGGTTPGTPGDVSLRIPELLESYKLGANEFADAEAGSQVPGAGDAGSSYSTQGVSLSFNDLPSRAQHLILNELMRQNSSETAVAFSTLPIPVEGTSLDEGATVQYLSDVEILCNELPPMLMVLSNNMTVTVSL